MEIEVIEMKVTIRDEDYEKFLLLCTEAEEEGLIDSVSIQVVKSYSVVTPEENE